MIPLSGKVISARNLVAGRSSQLFKLTTKETAPPEIRRGQALLVSHAGMPEGFGAYVTTGDQDPLASKLPDSWPVVQLPDRFAYLADGDVIRVTLKDERVRVLYRRASPHNTFLLTERCNHYCLMCSQPPKDIDDGWIVDEVLETLPLIDPETRELGFTGGEPTLLGDQLIATLTRCREVLPQTAIHVLTNGRRFADRFFALKWARIEHPDLMAGIPIYSDVSTRHDYVVQADGAFDETIRGILNLKELGQKVEIRVVLHKQTYESLPRLAEFIARNLLFVEHVALMGLEMTGFTLANLDELWIDPVEYQSRLYDAVQILDACRIPVSIYNLQLCLLDRRLWPFAVKAISDWKNEYFPQCDSCVVKPECGGFFYSSNRKHSAHIAPIEASDLI